jgi:hypothetical protein
MTPILRIGWKQTTKKQSAFNAVTSYTLAKAVTGTTPNFEIDYKKVLISRGNLTPVAKLSTLLSTNFFGVTWDDNSGIGNAKPTDKMLFVAYNYMKGEALTSYGWATRADGRFTFNTPPAWKGDRAHGYFGFISEDGKEVATSVYQHNMQIL